MESVIITKHVSYVFHVRRMQRQNSCRNRIPPSNVQLQYIITLLLLLLLLVILSRYFYN